MTSTSWTMRNWRWSWWAWTVTAAQFAVTYLPPLQAVLGTDAVPSRDGLLIVGVGAVFFAIIEIEKLIRLGLRG